MNYAFFDLDGTLYDNVMVIDFALNHPHNWKINFTNKTVTLRDHTARLVREYKKTHDYNKLARDFIGFLGAYYQGKNEEGFINDIFLFADNYPAHVRLSDFVLPVFTFLRTKGYKIVIVTNSPAPFAIFLDKLVRAKSNNKLFIDDFISTHFEIDSSGNYTGNLGDGSNADGKVSIIKKKFIDIEHSIAVGDSVGDIPMLRFAEKGFLITDNIPNEINVNDLISVPRSEVEQKIKEEVTKWQ